MRCCRAIAAVAASLVLGACSSEGNSGYGDYWKLISGSVKSSLGKTRVTLDQAAKVPYASMGWQLDHGDQYLIVLATDNNGEQLWTSAAHIVLVTQGGLIKRTVGLPHDLMALMPRDGHGLTTPVQALHGPYQDRRYADFPDLQAYSVEINCLGRLAGDQKIAILGKALTAARVEENCNAPSRNWTFRNVFWVDRDNGLVWRTSQSIHPGVTVQTEIFRPPG
jgi:hypothetical protein